MELIVWQKKSGEEVGYQHRKKGKTSNVLILTDGRGIPISMGEILSGNHNDLFEIIPQFSKMIKELKSKNIIVENSCLNADKGFDSKAFRRSCRRRKIMPNIKENNRNRKKIKRCLKREFNQKVFIRRFIYMGFAAHFVINDKANTGKHFLFIKVNIVLLKIFPNALDSVFVVRHFFVFYALIQTDSTLVYFYSENIRV